MMHFSASNRKEMFSVNIPKLPWAGIKFEFENIAIDLLYYFPAKLGEANDLFFSLESYGPVTSK
jgi:hypothetical protein